MANIVYDDLLDGSSRIYYYDLASAPNLSSAPQITGVGTLRFSENATITGTNFGASAGQVTIGGVVQPIVSWGDTSITIGPIARGTLRYGTQNVQVRDSSSVLSSLSPAALLPQTGWSYVNLVAPLASSGDRLTASPDLAGGDQVAYGGIAPSGTVTAYSDGSFTASATVGSFVFEVNDGTGWGSFATQNITEVVQFTGVLSSLPATINGAFTSAASGNQFSGALQAGAAQMSGLFSTFVGVTFNGVLIAGSASAAGDFLVTGEAASQAPDTPVQVDSVNPQSKVAIVNMALLKLGEPPIQSLQDNVKAARLASQVYDPVLDQELARHFWRFAIARKLIDEAVNDEPRGPFQYAYSLPADWLTTVWIGDLPTGTLPVPVDDVPEWSHEGRYILTNEAAPISLLYVRRVQDPTLFHAQFAELFSARLAMEMADSLTNSTTKWQKCRTLYKDALAEARRIQAIMEPPRFSTPSDSWLTSRN